MDHPQEVLEYDIELNRISSLPDAHRLNRVRDGLGIDDTTSCESMPRSEDFCLIITSVHLRRVGRVVFDPPSREPRSGHAGPLPLVRQALASQRQRQQIATVASPHSGSDSVHS